jgi:hypothetical protein
LNPTMMREMLDNPDYYFCYEVVPVDKNNDKLAQLMFVNLITQASQLFGMESLQVENLKKQYASIMGKSYDDIFLSPQEVQAKQQQMIQEQQMMAAQGIKPEVKSPVKPLEMSDMMK